MSRRVIFSTTNLLLLYVDKEDELLHIREDHLIGLNEEFSLLISTEEREKLKVEEDICSGYLPL